MTVFATRRPVRSAEPGNAETAIRIGLRWLASDTPSGQPAVVMFTPAVVFTSASLAPVLDTIGFAPGKSVDARHGYQARGHRMPEV